LPIWLEITDGQDDSCSLYDVPNPFPTSRTIGSTGIEQSREVKLTTSVERTDSFPKFTAISRDKQRKIALVFEKGNGSHPLLLLLLLFGL
jgi:hypothetical protein